MSGYVDITMPVRWDVRSGGTTKMLGCYVDAKLRVADDAEAPIVMEWVRIGRENQAFRAFQGQLLANSRHPARKVDDLMPLWSQKWQDVVNKRDDDWHRKNGYPFPVQARVSLNTKPVYVDDPENHPDLMHAVDLAKGQLSECVAVGGEIWSPTTGPVLQVSLLNENRFLNVVLMSDNAFYPRMKRDRTAKSMMSLLDARGVSDAFVAEFGLIQATNRWHRSCHARSCSSIHQFDG